MPEPSERRIENLEDSRAAQDYLKAIYKLQADTGRATTLALAVRLGVRPASVTGMIKRLAEDPGGAFVTHTPYHGVALTPRGSGVALEMIRHHRLIELFLTEHLGMPWEEVHVEAERLEHVLSERLEELIAAKLGQPLHDPHGDPIPARDLSIDIPDDVPLSSLGAGDTGVVSRVPDGDPALLQFLSDLRLVPGARVAVTAVASYGGVVTVRIGRGVHALGAEVARMVRVTVAPRP
ncbi:MAG TPA: metal-dependent transcriptional regulator [Candidatus Dormibacteraeota bacterium]|jgi:DtxR family Mn-dependent transcriptional regulator|nr:metal-dependent transcriptional regulator [Candidatus Dormibacteraeota bacterium]